MVSAAQTWSAMVSAIKALRRNARIPFDIGDGDHAINGRRGWSDATLICVTRDATYVVVDLQRRAFVHLRVERGR
jgi:hypothetical protein